MYRPTWSATAKALWAKSGDDQGFLSLPQHLMDSATVAAGLWDQWLSPGLQGTIARQLGISTEHARTLLIWLAGTHDIGKATRAFQGQVAGQPEKAHLCERVRSAGLPLNGAVEKHSWYPHGLGGKRVLERWLRRMLRERPSPEQSQAPTKAPMTIRERRLARDRACGRIPDSQERIIQGLSDVAGAHHGLPPMNADHDRAAHLDLISAEAHPEARAWWPVQDELVSGITEMTDAEPALLALLHEGRVTSEAQMLLTGIVIMADWIASSEELHPYLPSGTVCSEQEQRQRSEHGAQDLQLPLPWRPADLSGMKPADLYRRRFGWPEGRDPRPLQEEALRVAQGISGPALLCIEGPMGVGKTEAALAAGEVLAQRSGAGGLIFAAPTMATSDALFTRVQEWARNTDNGEPLSLYLGHSKNMLNRAFTSMPRRSSEADAPTEGPSERGPRVSGIAEGEHPKQKLDRNPEVLAHQWLWGRKKGILADIVVGTVDQVLFLGLQAKHAMLRHLGLAGKVVVIDEVHAYDAYMSSYLQKVLLWLGRYGTPVVLLSATLPQALKEQLVRAYLRGLTGLEADHIEVPETGEDYPVITAATHDGAAVHRVTAPNEQLPVQVQWMPDDDAALRDACTQVADDGGCLLVLCTTVQRAQQAYQIACEAAVPEDVRLVHARFVTADRIAQEQELVQELGPGATRENGGRPARRIVVATQVVEQSLDLDFDGMITDAAPMDLLLQRMGRVHRHQRAAADRPAWGREPVVRIRGLEDPGTLPEGASQGVETAVGHPTAPAGRDLPPSFRRELTLIYAEALLLTSWWQLRPHLTGAPIRLPADIPGLVQRSYTLAQEVPEGWRDRMMTARRDLDENRTNAERRANDYQFPAPWDSAAFADLWRTARREFGEAEGAAQVRDTDPSLEVVLVRGDDSSYAPLPWLDQRFEEVMIPRGAVPEPPIARVLTTSTVRLPHAFSYPSVFDSAVKQLEASSDEAWQQSPMLRGQLQLVLDEDLRGEVAGRRLRYDRRLGLLEEREKESATNKPAPENGSTMS